jgi:hypothetical protein
MSKAEVLEDSRKALRSAYDEMGEDVDDDDENAPWRKFAKLVWSGMDEDRILGPCIVCKEAGRVQDDGSPNMLRVIRAKKSGKSFVGCTGWKGADAEEGDPDSCDQTFPMPQPRFYDVHKLEETCSVCGRTPRVSVAQKFKPGRPWKLCFNDECPSMEEMKRKRAEREAAKAAKEAAKVAAGAEQPAGTKEAVAEAEKIAGQASATRVKRARNGSGSKRKAKSKAAAKPSSDA